MSKYWVGDDCQIGGPFDLWRKNYFFANGRPPDDMVKMYPALNAETVADIAKTSTVGATLEDVLHKFERHEPVDQLTMAYEYFSEWRKHAPFMPDFFQDVPLRPIGTSPEPLEEFWKDWCKHHKIEND
jgi:hypothetical protein